MPKNRPEIGDSNWGITLNEHLAQTSQQNGGFNYATSDPTLTADDIGYTYVNTSDNELKQWNGSSWIVLLHSNANSSGYTIAAEINVDGAVLINTITPVDVSANSVVITPPSSPVSSDKFRIIDSKANAGINNIVVDFVTSSQPLHNNIQNDVLNMHGDFREYIYVDSTIGWVRM